MKLHVLAPISLGTPLSGLLNGRFAPTPPGILVDCDSMPPALLDVCLAGLNDHEMIYLLDHDAWTIADSRADAGVAQTWRCSFRCKKATK